MVFRTAAATVLLLLGAALLCAETFARTVTDDQGHALTLVRPPQRIVSLTLPTDEILLSLVERRRILRVTAFSADPHLSWVSSIAAGIPRIAGLNVEEIITLSPDLVLVADWSDAARVDQLRGAGVPVYVTASARTAGAVAARIRRIALLTGEEEQGERMAQELSSRLEAVARKVSGIPPDKRARILDYSVWGGAMGRGSTWDEVVRLAGLVNAAGGLSADAWGQVPLSREKLLELDPDILALPGWLYGSGNEADRFTAEVAADPALRLLKAVRNGRILRVPGTVQETSSQYLASAVEWLARAAYPERFKEARSAVRTRGSAGTPGSR
jgi:iron complex transport system substrate-binding protein